MSSSDLVLADRPAAATITAGTIVAFTTLQSRLFFPIGSMLQVSTEISSSVALFDRIFEYLDLPQDVRDAPGAVALDPSRVRGAVRFDGVRFRYDRPEDGGEPRPWTLDGIDLAIEPGQLAALVGPSGAGKTTMTYLVPRLYDVDEGAVEIDGLDVRRIDRKSTRLNSSHMSESRMPSSA